MCLYFIINLIDVIEIFIEIYKHRSTLILSAPLDKSYICISLHNDYSGHYNSSTPEYSLWLLISNVPFPNNYYFIIFHWQILLPVLEIHVNRIIQQVLFCVRLLFLRTVFWDVSMFWCVLTVFLLNFNVVCNSIKILQFVIFFLLLMDIQIICWYSCPCVIPFPRVWARSSDLFLMTRIWHRWHDATSIRLSYKWLYFCLFGILSLLPYYSVLMKQAAIWRSGVARGQQLARTKGLKTTTSCVWKQIIHQLSL